MIKRGSALAEAGEPGAMAAGGEEGLSPQQRMALVKLSEGRSVIASAKAAGVNRATVHRWLKADPVFTAAYNAWQQEAMATARARLVALADDAVSAVGSALEKKDVKTALTVLRSLGVLREPKPGPTDAGEVQRERAVEQRRREGKLLQEEMMAGLG